MLKRYTVCFLFLLFVLSVQAQLSEQFSDGDFTNNPSWQGDLGNFIVNTNQELQLNAAAAGSSRIYTNYNLPDSSIFEVLIRMPFAPSGSNRLRWYFQASDADFTIANGYYIEIGETGSGDALRVYRQTGALKELISSGTAGLLGSGVNVRVRVERRSGNNWTLKADYSGGSNFQLESSFTESTFVTTGNEYFGFQCDYTASNITKFYFDNISVQAILQDLSAPVLTNVEIIGNQELNLIFDEAIDGTSIQASDFDISPSIGNPIDAFLNAPNQITLILASPLQNAINYQLAVSGISDLSANESGVQTYNFTFLDGKTPESGDLLITEIYADPDATSGLPFVEYIEIFNASNDYLSLKEVIFSDASSDHPLPDIILIPGEYRVICDQTDTSLFTGFGPSLGIPSFPTLTNSGEKLTLKTSLGVILQQVEYTLSWYQDAVKSAGGWSLEMINPINMCSGSSNWIASKDPKGGTPGLANSVFENTPDTTGIKITQVIPDSDTQLSVYFSKSISGDISNATSLFHILPVLGINSISYDPAIPNLAVIHLNNPLQKSILYQLIIDPGIQDCQGKANEFEQVFSFGLPDDPQAGDIVINEILFNPATGGTRYVEIFNNSDKIFRLNDLLFQNIYQSGSPTSAITEASLFFPGQYAVFTENRADILSRFSVISPDWLFENDLPSLSDKDDNISLLFLGNAGLVTLDSLDYNEDWHSPFLQDKNGVALERIMANAPTNQASNWQSAATLAGYGTPTAPNSQNRPQDQSGDLTISIPQPVLSPDGDGYQDFLLIHYNTQENGGVAQIRIFDVQGHPIRTLKSLSLLGESGDFKWEGDLDNGEKARIGIYTILVEIAYPDGHKTQAKANCVVAAKF